MKTTKILMMVSVAALGLAAVGCDSGSTCTDGGVCTGAGGSKGGSTGSAGGSTGAGGGPALFAVTPGTYCFEVLSILPGSADDCDTGAADIVTTPPTALPVTYYAAATTVGGVAIPAGTIEVGTDGSLGRGVIDKNKATLLRDNTAILDAAPACTWHQTDTSLFTLTAENAFALGVTESQETFAAACATTTKTVKTGTCTSTWTWTMKIMAPQSATAPPPACQAP